jgi:ankyrin repeat protein
VACWNNKRETVSKLIELKANVNQADHRGWTPLIISVYQNNEEVADLLLEAGCDIEKKDCVVFK